MTKKNIVITYLIALNINICFSQEVINHNFYKAYYPNEEIKGTTEIITYKDSIEINSNFKSVALNKTVINHYNICFSNTAFYIPSKITQHSKYIDSIETKDYAMTITTSHKDSIQYWNKQINGKTVTKKSAYPTTSYRAILHILSTLDYSSKGKLLTLNLTKVKSFRREALDAQLIYEKDIIIKKGDLNLNLKKIVLYEDGFKESGYWLDQNNNLVIISIGLDLDKTVYKKYDNVDEHEVFKDIFEEIDNNLILTKE